MKSHNDSGAEPAEYSAQQFDPSPPSAAEDAAVAMMESAARSEREKSVTKVALPKRLLLRLKKIFQSDTRQLPARK